MCSVREVKPEEKEKQTRLAAEELALTAETLIEEKEVTAETLVEEEEKKGEKQEEDGFTVVTYKKSKAKKNKLAAKKAVLTAETLIEEEGRKARSVKMAKRRS